MQNDMRDRLVNLIIEAMPYSEIERQPNKLADYLIANGVIVLPCKVGDTVYIIDYPDYAEYYVLDVKVENIGMDNNGLWVVIDLPLGMNLSKYVFPNNLGKTVFLTNEQAEQKLKEMRVENGN